MAKVQFGALVQDARGKLGAIVFSRNQYGSISRTKVSPKNPKTTRQMAQRAIMGSTSKAWASLTSLNRASWATWAANHPFTNVFGNSLTLSAQAAFLQVNTQRLTLGLSQSNDPSLLTPTTQGPAPTSASADPSTGVVTITFPTAPSADDLYMIFMTPGLPPTINFAGKRPRLAAAGKPGASTTWAITPSTFNPKLAFTIQQKLIILCVQFTQSGVQTQTTRLECTSGSSGSTVLFIAAGFDDTETNGNYYDNGTTYYVYPVYVNSLGTRYIVYNLGDWGIYSTPDTTGTQYYIWPSDSPTPVGTWLPNPPITTTAGTITAA